MLGLLGLGMYLCIHILYMYCSYTWNPYIMDLIIPDFVESQDNNYIITVYDPLSEHSDTGDRSDTGFIHCTSNFISNTLYSNTSY